MDLTLLRSFLAVHRTGSFTKAAALLSISQPAVTSQIRNLEQDLGQLLFLRTPRGAVPTESAHELARETGAHLDALEAALVRRKEPLDLSERTISLAGPAEVISVWMLPALADLIREGLRLRVTLGLTDELLDGLQVGLHDLVVATKQPRTAGIVATPLIDEEFSLVGSPEEARRIAPELIDALGPQALDHVPILSYAENLPIVRRYWMTVFQQRPDFSAQVVVPDLRAVLAAVKAGAGVSVLPAYLCAGELERGEIEVLHEPELRPLNTLFLAVRSGAATNGVLSSVHSHLLTKAGLCPLLNA
ncbi:LysR family transcriptional regulator [Nonomuraea longicatena]|uniref:LysR family transcriptional regulator n=1 Tax=Nonomuraea longicatena TaxID=83682 RepID=UPI0031D477E7